MFNHTRLSIARMRRRLTNKELAEQAGVAAFTITRLQNGQNRPDQETVEKIAGALRYPVAFFYGDDLDLVQSDAVSFRSLTKMTARERNAATTAGSLGLHVSHWIEDRFSLPKSSLLDLSHETNPEIAARSLRQHWGLGVKPVGHMIRLLEAHGVRIFALSENTASVDAFSFWQGDRPFIFLNNFKTAERSVFDAAHELAHLVIHKHAGTKDALDAEREANAFASAFLMPGDDVRPRMPRLITTEVILKAKIRWRVSAMALAYRLHALKCLSDWQYKSTCIELGRCGYRTGEPQGIEHERSAVWSKVLSQLWSERITRDDIAEELNIPIDELEALVGGVVSALAPSPVRLPNRLHIVK